MRARSKQKQPKHQNLNKDRYGVALSKTVREQAMELAEQEKRSFSNFLSVLITREYERQKAASNYL